VLHNLKRKAFGKCPDTNNNGQEAASDSASSSSNLDASGSGIELIKFRGRFISEQARDNILDREESIRQARKHRRSREFRQRVGFKNSV